MRMEAARGEGWSIVQKPEGNCDGLEARRQNVAANRCCSFTRAIFDCGCSSSREPHAKRRQPGLEHRAASEGSRLVVALLPRRRPMRRAFMSSAHAETDHEKFHEWAERHGPPARQGGDRRAGRDSPPRCPGEGREPRADRGRPQRLAPRRFISNAAPCSISRRAHDGQHRGGTPPRLAWSAGAAGSRPAGREWPAAGRPAPRRCDRRAPGAVPPPRAAAATRR